MLKLRILEEDKRKPKFLIEKDKMEIIESIRNMILRYENIVLAVIHGGFIQSNIFRDIDILLCLDIPLDDLDYIDELRENLEKIIKIGVDIQLINNTPPKFIIKALEHGLVLIERRPGIRSIIKIHALEEEKKLMKLKIFNS